MSLNELIKKIEKAKDKSKKNQENKRFIIRPTKYHFECGIEETCTWILKDLKPLEAELLRMKEELESFPCPDAEDKILIKFIEEILR